MANYLTKEQRQILENAKAKASQKKKATRSTLSKESDAEAKRMAENIILGNLIPDTDLVVLKLNDNSKAYLPKFLYHESLQQNQAPKLKSC